MRISGGAPDVRADLGVSLIGLGQTDLGLAQLQQAFAKEPGQARAGVALATLYLRRDQPKKAIEVIDTVATHEPNNAAVANMKGSSMARRAIVPAHAPRTSVRSRSTLAITRPGSTSRGSTWTRVSRSARGSALRDLLKSEPRNGDAMFEIALLEERAGNADEAVRWLEKAMTVPRQVAHSGAYLTDVLVRQRNTEQALAVSKQTLASTPKDLPVLFARSRALIAAGDVANARLTLKNAASSRASAPRRISSSPDCRSRPRMSRERFTVSIGCSERNPGDLPAMVLLAEIHIASGDYAKSELLIRQIGERHTTHGVAMRLTGDLAVTRGQPVAAIASYRAALAKDRKGDAAIRVIVRICSHANPSRDSRSSSNGRARTPAMPPSFEQLPTDICEPETLQRREPDTNICSSVVPTTPMC